MNFAVIHVALLGVLAVRASSPFNIYDHLGNLSPYQDAPNLSGLGTDLPDSCTVDQVLLVCLIRRFVENYSFAERFIRTR